jgi:hypothetical protein
MPVWTHFFFCCALCMIQMPWRTNPLRYTQGVVTAPFLNSSGVIVKPATPFFCLDRGKTSSQALPDVLVGVRKKPQAAQFLFFCVHYKKLPGSLRNRPKVYQVNGRWWWRCTTFISPAIPAKSVILEDYFKRAYLKKIDSSTFVNFYENSLQWIAAEI